MGGSGSGYFPSDITPDNVKEVFDTTIKKIKEDEYWSKVNEEIKKQLPDINDRDVSLTNERIGKVKEVLGSKIEGSINSCFGGSVGKHTYVNGLSDIDCLLLINDTELEKRGPEQALNTIKSSIQLEENCEISSGRMAITVKFADGMEIQLLPALKSGDKYKVSSSNGNNWSKNIDPKKFSEALTEANEKQAGKLIPTIKLAKVALSTLKEDMRPNGYHIESMAIKAFKDYNGSKDPLSMTNHFFSKMPDLVLKSEEDKTAQSIYVDSYLGKKNSTERKNMNHLIDRLHKRIRNYIHNKSKDELLKLFNINDESTK